MIDALEINKMIRDCFFKPEEGKPNEGEFVKVEGLIKNFGFHPKRLADKKARLIELMNDLHPNFMKNTGGGWTFLNLPFEKDGRHWGEHPDCEAFIAMCIGNGLAKYSMPREMWDALPGGVPYVVFSKEGFDEEN
jgi:hypothetical protein